MVDPGEHVTVTLKREFGEEALNSLEADENKKRELQLRINEFFAKGSEVFIAVLLYLWIKVELMYNSLLFDCQ